MKTLDQYVESRKLQLLRASPIESRSFVNVPALGYREVRTYNWPAAPKQGRKYDQTVLIGIYEDGSFSVFVESMGEQHT